MVEKFDQEMPGNVKGIAVLGMFSLMNCRLVQEMGCMVGREMCDRQDQGMCGTADLVMCGTADLVMCDTAGRVMCGMSGRSSLNKDCLGVILKQIVHLQMWHTQYRGDLVRY